MSSQTEFKSLFSHRLFWMACLFWTGIITASLVWTLYQDSKHNDVLMKRSAEAIHEMDLEYRPWNASHGGVYVPITEKTPSNPYLSHIPERDITTAPGKKLTLMNPAYMTRQVHEAMAEKSGARGHITSLNLIREENSADPWEVAALKKFEQGAVEVSSIEMMEEGKPSFRYMKSMTTKKACLTCHARQGHKVGDIRGRISVSIPVDQELSIHVAKNTMNHAHIWLAGLRFISLNLRKQLISKIILKKRESHIRLLLDSTAEAIYGLDCDGNCTFANQACLKMVGYTSIDELLGTNMHELIHHTRPDATPYPVQECRVHEAFVKGEGTHVDDELLWRKDGSSFDAEYWSYPIVEDGQTTGSVVTFINISDRRASESKAERRLDELERFQKVSVQREFRIKELRDEVEAPECRAEALQRQVVVGTLSYEKDEREQRYA